VLSRGTTHLWANTILFASHPLQTSRVAEFEDDVRIIGQPPLMVELFDDKEYVNDFLRTDGRFTMPKSWTVDSEQELETLLKGGGLVFPLVGKPIRGRGSYGVKVCRSNEELQYHVQSLFRDSPRIMLEEYLAGEEATITVFPPALEEGRNDYWASPIVTRFNHEDGVAPFNSIVAVTSNSRALTSEEFKKDMHYQNAARECEEVAKLLKVTGAIRVDVRRFKEDGKFALFDINMKPVSLELLNCLRMGWDG
jgi:carbamoylphosphate synthase large subunit